MKVGKNWYKDHYDEFLAAYTLDDQLAHQNAAQEIRFLRKMLKIEKNQKILDIPCGRGRHSILLAQKGHSIVGVDISKACIRGARKKITPAIRPHTRFESGDMQNLKKYQSKFDLVLNLFTSFGYFPTDSANEKVMKNLIFCLRPQGKLCLFLINRENLLPRLHPKSWDEFKDQFVLQKMEYNPKTKYHSAEWIFISKKTGAIRRYYHRIRLYNKDEIVTMMKKFGLKNIRVYGGTDGSRYHHSKSHHPVFIGTQS